jgi:hypothetical protein
VQWARIAFGPDADVVAFVKAPNQTGVATIAIRINEIKGVAGTATTILATVGN